MHILVICNWGKNRSKYLASFLEQKGYTVKFGGIIPASDNVITKQMVHWANILIFVEPKIKETFLKHFTIKNQQIITLNVADHTESSSPEDWLQIQQQQVYPKLERQIAQYLPLTLKPL